MYVLKCHCLLCSVSDIDELIFEPLKAIWHDYYREKVLENKTSKIVESGKMKSEGETRIMLLLLLLLLFIIY